MTRSTFFKTLLGLAGVPFVKANPKLESYAEFRARLRKVLWPIASGRPLIVSGPRSTGKSAALKERIDAVIAQGRAENLRNLKYFNSPSKPPS